MEATSRRLGPQSDAYRAAYRKHWEERIGQWACSPSTQQELEERGFSILRGAFNAGDVDMLLHELPWHLEGGAVKMEQQNKGSGGYVLSCKGSSRLARPSHITRQGAAGASI